MSENAVLEVELEVNPVVEPVVDRLSDIENFHKLIKDAKTVAVFSHSYVDPDAIASIMAIEWICNKINPNVETMGFFDGVISHPQNVAMVNLLDPKIQSIVEYDPKNWDLKILVDTVPLNAGVGNNQISFSIVVDHHKEIPNGGFSGLFINLKAGSCCGTIYHLMKSLNFEFNDEIDNDVKVATAMLVGISTDTESLMSDDASNYEFDAWSELFGIRNSAVLRKIINFEVPKFWIEHKASAVEKAVVDEGVGVVGIGVIPSKHRDMIADMADNMVSWEDVHTAVVFAIVDGNEIVGCVRSRNASVMVSQLCKVLATKHGSGGGKLGKGAYHYSLGGTAFEEEEDETTKQEIWRVLNSKETKRILRVISK
jgi:nanoRNase/pAp phosphatase (c-di-AMP/oligoRNAs hydrolase)